MRAAFAAFILFASALLWASDVSDKSPAWNAVKLASFNRGDASDASWSAQTPTVVGNTAFASRVVEFDGGDDYIHYPDADSLSFTDGAGTDRPFSVSAWVRMDSATGLREVLSKEDYNGTNQSEWAFRISSGKLQGCILAQSGNTGKIRAGNTTTLSTATWYHVAMTYSGSETVAGIKLYVNGAEESAYTTALDTTMNGMANTTAKVYIGINSGTQSPNYDDFDGKIDNVKIFASELSANEIGAIYASEIGESRP